MIKEISAGGVVFFRSNILLLRKYNGDWVLPKGRLEESELLEQTALREVFEESNVKAELIKYIGKIKYEFNRTAITGRVQIQKEVHWYLMRAKNITCSAQKKEGFNYADYVPFKKACLIAKYDDEKKIIQTAIDEIKFYQYE